MVFEKLGVISKFDISLGHQGCLEGSDEHRLRVISYPAGLQGFRVAGGFDVSEWRG